jgi:hypothetical protein
MYLLIKQLQNSIFTLQSSFEHRSIEEKEINYIEKAGYKDNIRQAFADFLDKKIEEIPNKNPEKSLILTTPYNRNIESIKPNVILIVMESFGDDLIKYNSEKFNVLDGLKKTF